MDGIKIDVSGNIARVVERPDRITSGTVGLPVEFTFDSHWDGLSKTAVFMANRVQINVENLEAETVVPWEVLQKPKVWLSIGVYGVNADGDVAIPTIWANVCVISVGTEPDGDPATDPKLPVWQSLLNDVGELDKLQTEEKENLVKAINEANTKAMSGGVSTDPTLSIEGRAADAKVTGEAIADVVADVQDTGNRVDTLESLIHGGNKLPIANGGTGAGSASQALNNLGAAAKSHTHAVSDIASGTMPIARGGTGMTSNPSLLVNLGSTQSANVLQESPRPGITGTLPIANGGTGATNVTQALRNLGIPDDLESMFEDVWTEFDSVQSELGDVRSQFVDVNNEFDRVQNQFDELKFELNREGNNQGWFPNTDEWTTPGALSKFYILTIRINGKDYSLAVDWQGIRAAGTTGRTFGIAFLNSGNEVKILDVTVKVNTNSTVTFDAAGGTIVHVVGYY